MASFRQTTQADVELRARFCSMCRLSLNVIRLALVALLVLVVLPVGISLLINLTIIIPFQVRPRKTLIFGFAEHWIFGILHFKAAILLTLAGPNWWLRARIEAFGRELKQRRTNASSLHLLSVVAPLIAGTGLCLSCPYLLAHYSAPLFNVDREFMFRYVYLATLAFVVLLLLCAFQIHQLKSLYRRIKDEKYLIGKRLVNFKSNAERTMERVAT